MVVLFSTGFNVVIKCKDHVLCQVYIYTKLFFI